MWALNTLNSTLNWAVGTTQDNNENEEEKPIDQKFPIDLDNSFTLANNKDNIINENVEKNNNLLDIDITSPMKTKNNNIVTILNSPVEFINDVLVTDSTNIIVNKNNNNSNSNKNISAISPIIPNNISEPDLNDLDKSVIDRSMTDIDTELNLSLGGV